MSLKSKSPFSIFNISWRECYIFISNFLIVLIFLFPISCKKNNDKFRSLLSDYIGKPLILPPDSVLKLLDSDYGVSFLSDVDYKIISYINSDGCTPCHLHLPYWKELSVRLDTFSNAIAETLLIIKPDTVKKVVDFLRKAHYDHPVIIDSLGYFETINHLPTAPSLRTFLIDHKNRIIALGNPIEHEEIARYYIELISGQKESNSNTPLIIRNNKIDLGTVSHDFSKEFVFIVENSSSDSISVENVITPCNCLSIEADNIPANGNGKITLSFDASETNGAFHHAIGIRYKNIVSPVILHLYGYVYDN